MILPVSNLQTKDVIKQNPRQNKINYFNQEDNFNKSLIKSNIVFKGKIEDEIKYFFGHTLYDGHGFLRENIKYGEVEYSETEIRIAKKYMHAKDTSWRDTLYKEALEESRRLYGYQNIGESFVSDCKTRKGRFFARTALAIYSLGGSELGNQLDKILDPRPSHEKRARTCVDRISTLIQHLKNEELINANKLRQTQIETTKGKLDKKLADVEAQNQAAIAKTQYLNKLSSKKNQLATEFFDKINLEKRGSNIDDIPNAIMIEDPYDDVSKELIDYTKRNSQSRFIKLSDIDNDTLMDNLDETLKNSKKHFDLTKERTLIQVEGFDRLITKGKNSFENIESLKDIMCKTAKDFGSTILFKTKNASKLVSEAIQPQRVLRILVDFKSVI